MTDHTLHTRVVCVEILPWWRRLTRPARAVVSAPDAALRAEAAGMSRRLVSVTSAAPVRVHLHGVDPWDQPKGLD